MRFIKKENLAPGQSVPSLDRDNHLDGFAATSELIGIKFAWGPRSRIESIVDLKVAKSHGATRNSVTAIFGPDRDPSRTPGSGGYGCRPRQRFPRAPPIPGGSKRARGSNPLPVPSRATQGADRSSSTDVFTDRVGQRSVSALKARVQSQPYLIVLPARRASLGEERHRDRRVK